MKQFLFATLIASSLFCSVNNRYMYVSVGSYPVDVNETKFSLRESSKFVPSLNYGFRYRAGGIGLEGLADTLFKHTTIYANIFLIPHRFNSPFIGIGGIIKTIGKKTPLPRAQLGYEWGNPRYTQFFSIECTSIDLDKKTTTAGMRFGFKV
jgi:hypothetical protein